MLRTGCIILTLWTVLNLIPSLVILTATLFYEGHTPALYLLLNKEEVSALAPDVLDTLDSIAIFANGMNSAFCFIVLFTIWKGLYHRRAWAFWGLSGGFTIALLTGIGADYVIGFAAPWVNWISGIVLGLGLATTAPDVLRAGAGRDSGN